MTDRLRQVLSASSKAVRDSGGRQRVSEVPHVTNDALAECQGRVADRAKRIESRVEKIDGTLDSINLRMTDITTSHVRPSNSSSDMSTNNAKIAVVGGETAGETAQKIIEASK